MKVDINSYGVVKKATGLFDMLDAEGFQTLSRMMVEEKNKYSDKPKDIPAYVYKEPRANTDWQDEVFRRGFAQSHSVSVRGGGEVAQFSISANIYDEKGIVLDNNFLMQNARMKVNTKKSILISLPVWLIRRKREAIPIFLLRKYTGPVL